MEELPYDWSNSERRTEFYLHVIMAVKGRESLIAPDWEDDLYDYIAKSAQAGGNKMLEINGTRDHIHFLVDLNPEVALDDIIGEIKKSSILFVKEQGFARSNFNWQQGYAAFSCSPSTLPRLFRYIKTQKLRHKKLSFKDEFIFLLKRHEIEFKEEDLFEWIEL